MQENQRRLTTLMNHCQGIKNDLSRRDDLLRILIKALPDLVWLKNPAGVFLACNSRFERLFGAEEKEIIGKTDYDFLNKGRSDFFRDMDKRAIAEGKPRVNEEEMTYADDGHSEILETVKAPIYNDGGSLIGVLCIARDITDRNKTELEIRKLLCAIEQSPVSVVIADIHGNIEYVNPKYNQITGYTLEEVKGKNPRILKSGEHPRKLK